MEYYAQILRLIQAVPNLSAMEIADHLIGCKYDYTDDWQKVYKSAFRMCCEGFLKETGMKGVSPLYSITFIGIWSLHVYEETLKARLAKVGLC